jgi:hypothetical protein
VSNFLPQGDMGLQLPLKYQISNLNSHFIIFSFSGLKMPFCWHPQFKIALMIDEGIFEEVKNALGKKQHCIY